MEVTRCRSIEVERTLGLEGVHQHDGVLEVEREVAERERRQVVHRRRHEVDDPPPGVDVVAGQVGARVATLSRDRDGGGRPRTAFGRPVVPDVYCRNWPGARSAGPVSGNPSITVSSEVNPVTPSLRSPIEIRP